MKPGMGGVPDGGAVRLWLDAFRAGGRETALDRSLAAMPGYFRLESMAEVARLTRQVLEATFTSTSWVRPTIVEASRIFRTSTIPLLIATVAYMVAFGSILLAEVLHQLGAGDRAGPGMYQGLLRELSTWITYMVLAAIVGSAAAGDLGARKIREELDALEVLGVDKVRTLVVPRVLALTFAGVVLFFVNLLADISATQIVDQWTVHLPLLPQIQATFLAMNWYDVAAATLKNAILGFFIGIVACAKGLSAQGGAEGVGRAVNETVVITFFGIWVINSLYNTGYFTVVPESLSLLG